MTDDFFEDDVVEEKPKPEKRPAGKTRTSAKKAVEKRVKEKSSGEPFAFSLSQKVDMIWVIAVAIAAFTVGFLVHYWGFARTTESGTQPLNTGNYSAPPLTQEQIEKYQKQGLPAGHPNIGGVGESTSQPSGSQEQTQSSTPGQTPPSGATGK